jgi:hypothetical protein
LNRILIRRQYPVVRTQLDYGGAIGREWLRQNPPDYRSRGGRVERWTADALRRRRAADDDWWGITGPTDVLPLDRSLPWAVEQITPHSRSRYNLTGPRAEMDAVLELITRQWWQLPRGREFTAAHERAFPRRLDLEVEPTITRTPTRRRRKTA